MIMIMGFIIYLILIALIALVAYCQQSRTLAHDTSALLIGNRSINYWLTALSAHASDMSDWLFMAFPAMAYASGAQNAWIIIGLVLGMFANWHFIAKPLRIATEKYDAYTLATFFERHFHDTSGRIKLASACMTLLFFAVYIAAGLKGIGFLLESVFDINYYLGVWIAVTCVALYTMLGGFAAVAWIDAFQALFLLTMVVLVPVIAWQKIGGAAAIATAAALRNVSLKLLPDTSLLALINLAFVTLSWALPYMGMPHILVKFMGAANPEDMKKAKWIGVTWQITVLTASLLVGLIGLAFFPTGLANKELIFVEMVQQLFIPIVAGFVLSAVAAATLSTVDSQVLVLSATLTEDLFARASKKTTRFAFRVSILTVALLAGLIGMYKAATIQSLVYYAWMGFGCSFGPLVIMSLYGSGINRYGALAGILTGGTVAAIWHFVMYQPVLAWGLNLPALIPGFILSLVAIVAVSRVTTE